MAKSNRLLHSIPLLLAMAACGKSHDHQPGIQPTVDQTPEPIPTEKPKPAPTGEPLPGPALVDFKDVFQPVERVVCRDESEAKGIGGTFKRLAYGFDACEFSLRAKDGSRLKALSGMKILNPNSKWGVTFKPSEGNDLTFDVSLKRDTSVVQFSDYG